MAKLAPFLFPLVILALIATGNVLGVRLSAGGGKKIEEKNKGVGDGGADIMECPNQATCVKNCKDKYKGLYRVAVCMVPVGAQDLVNPKCFCYHAPAYN